MPSRNTLVFLVILLFATPTAAWAGLNVFPADGPAPTLHVEQPKPLEYKVQKGDTVAAIAKKFSIGAKALMSANGMTDARKLKAGQTLKIPGKTAPAAPAPAKIASAPPKASATPAKAQAAKPAEPIAPAAPAKGVTTAAPSAAPAGSAAAPRHESFGKTGVIMNNTDVPQQIRDEFFVYAKKWIADLERLGVGTLTNKKIKKVGDHWEASYRVIVPESLGAEVKRVQYSHTPYVGHITYVQHVYTCSAPTKQAALAGPYTSKDESIREIFSYSGKKKAWR